MAEVEDVARTPEPTFRPRIRPELDNNRAGASSPEPNCAICLGQLKNISYTNNCLHRFCFACIQEWSKIKQECPLCKQNFSSIIHNVRSENDYDQCNVVAPSLHEAWNQLVQAYRQGMERNRHNSMEYQLRNIQFNGVTFMNRSELSLPLLIPFGERRSNRFRLRVYREMLYSASLRNRTGIPRESSPEFYRSNPAELNRLESFFTRDLALLITNPVSANDAVRSVKLELQISSIRSPAFHGILRYYLDNTRAFIFRHELYNFAVSGYDVVGYDKYVKYYPHGIIGVPPRHAGNRNYLPEIPREEDQEEGQDVQELHVEIDDIEEIADTDATPPLHQVRNIPSPARDVLTISDSGSGSDDCEIIQVVRPQDRVFDVIYLSSDEDDIVHIIESSSESSSNSDSEFNDTEEQQSVVAKEEHEPRVDFFNLPSTSHQSDSHRSYTPPLVLDLSMSTQNGLSPQTQVPKIEVQESHEQEIPVSLKRRRSDNSSESSSSSIDPMPSRTRRRKRMDMLKNRIGTRSESSSSEDCDSSSSTRHRPVRRRRRQLQRRHVSSSSSSGDSSEYQKHCSRSISSSEDEKKDRKRKLKKSKRERHGESSSKSRRISQDKKSKKRKKRRSSKHRDSKHDSKHRRSEKKSSRRSY